MNSLHSSSTSNDLMDHSIPIRKAQIIILIKLDLQLSNDIIFLRSYKQIFPSHKSSEPENTIQLGSSVN